jgi:hypothetical protein
MPRYFFHLTMNGRVTPDQSGTVLPDVRAARSQGISACGEMLKDLDGKLPAFAEWRMDVVDHAGQTVLTFRFSEDARAIEAMYLT